VDGLPSLDTRVEYIEMTGRDPVDFAVSDGLAPMQSPPGALNQFDLSARMDHQVQAAESCSEAIGSAAVLIVTAGF
jgi:hypothetical protein